MTDSTTKFPIFDGSSLAVIGHDHRADRVDGLQLPERIGNVTIDTRLTIPRRRREALRLIREDNARQVIGQLPDADHDIVLLMDGTYHGMDIIAAMLDLADCPAVESYIATLGTNKSNIDQLCGLIDGGKLSGLTMLVADVFAQKDVIEFAYLTDQLGKRGARVAVSRNHAKIMQFKLADGRHIVAHGSLNLRRCNSYEQVAVTQDAELYKFFKAFIETIIAGGITP